VSAFKYHDLAERRGGGGESI